jgi:hypothetical protein
MAPNRGVAFTTAVVSIGQQVLHNESVTVINLDNGKRYRI